MNKITELVKKINAAATAYYNGSEIISDDEYDALVYELTSLDPNNAVLSKVGAEPTVEWTKEKHLIPLGSLDKVNFPHEMTKWVSDTLGNKPVLVVEKLDGLSIGCQYDNGKLVKACLRGNGLEGENILSNVLKMKGVISKVPSFTGTIRGEIVLTKTDHQAHFASYANPRNAASGICRRLDGDGCEHLTLMFYQVVGDDDFNTEEDIFKFLNKYKFILPNYKLCNNSQEVNDLWQQYQDITRDSLDYEIDGLVVYCNDVEFQQSLGFSNNRPCGKLAFKFANQFVKTTVTKIEWDCGNSGRITPVCWFEPISLLGSTVNKASVYNIDYIQKLQLDVGAEVLICKANEIIPRVEKVIKGSGTIAKIPDHCPSCNTPTEMDGKNLTCPNLDCSARLLGRLHNWVNELNLLEWGAALLEKVVAAGLVETVADLYTLEVDDIANLDRLGEKTAKKCLKILHDNADIPLEIFLGGLSIPLIGQSTIKLIMKSGCNTLEKFMDMTAEDFEKVSGVGPTKAQSLFDGLIDNQDLIDELLDNGVTIKSIVQGSLTGKSVTFTGAMVNKRAILEKMAADAGGEVKNSVGRGLSFLVISDVNSTSSKAVNARKFGTTLLTEEDFLKLVQ